VWKRNKQQIPTSSPGADNAAPSIQNINAPVFKASEKVVAHGRTWDMSDWLPLKGFQTGTVFVQLIDVHNSRVLFQGEFALNTNLLSITPLFPSEAASRADG